MIARARRGRRVARVGSTRALFGADVWPGVAFLLEQRELRLLVAFDLDGTLAPIVTRPERARVPASMIHLLRRAERIPTVTVAVVTARSARDLARLLPVRGIIRAAQYGLEGVDRPPLPTRIRWRRAASTIASLLAPVAASTPGAWVEFKGMTVAIHDRGVAPGRLPRLRRSIAGIARRASPLGFRPIAGRRVTEFAPRGIDKRRALTSVRRRAAADAVFYFGDSAADEPAFRSLGPGGYSVRVGPGPTRARYRVRDPRGVSRFLRALLSLRDG